MKYDEDILEKFREVRPNLIYDRKVKKEVISGTDIGAIMGYNPYVTAYDVWLKRKFGFITPVDNSYIQAGLKLESVIARKYYLKQENRKNWKLIKGKKCASLLDANIFVGTPDFIVRDNYSIQDSEHGLEIKTSQSEWLDVPTYYKLQCYWYMRITGFSRWNLAVLINGHTYKEYMFTADTYLEREMVREAMNFYRVCLKGDIEPFDMLCQQKSKYIHHCKETCEDVNNLISNRNDCKRIIETAEESLKKIELNLKSLIQDREGFKTDRYLVTWKTQSRETIDYKKIIEDHKIDVEPYKKQGDSFRVLRVKEL